MSLHITQDSLRGERREVSGHWSQGLQLTNLNEAFRLKKCPEKSFFRHWFLTNFELGVLLFLTNFEVT